MKITMTKNELKWDIGWFGAVPTDEPERATSRQNFFVYCAWCDRWHDNHLLKCESEKDMIELYKAYRKRINLSKMGFTVTDSDIEAIAERTWKDENFQEAKKEKLK